MPETDRQRGSHKLLASLGEKGAGATKEDIRTALALPAETSFQLIRYFPRGIPPVYELEATLLGPVSDLGTAINHLAANSNLRGINILINGIPAAETAQVTVQLAARGE